MHAIRLRFGLLLVAVIVAVSASFSASVPPIAHADSPPLLDIRAIRANAQGYSADFTFPDPARVAITKQIVTGASQTFVRLVLPDNDTNNQTAGLGTPEIPYYRRIVAAPKGTARIDVKFGAPSIRETLLETLIFPVQQETIDPKVGEFGDLPFQYNPNAYGDSSPVPASDSLVVVTPLGTVRDLELFALDLAVAQYLPSRQAITLYSGIKVDLTFVPGQTGDGSFLDSPNLNPFEDQVSNIYAGAINYAAVSQGIRELPFKQLPCYGSEFVIITPPAFRAAADTLRTWKNAKGISTVVFETGNAAGQAGTTRAQIQTFVRNRFANCAVRLSYLLLLGDAEFIAPFYRNTVGTDLDYSLMNNVDILPDIAIGRIPVDTLAQAQTVVDKIVAYEKTPPFAPSFYRNASLASFFQCCRLDGGAAAGTDMRQFIETSELVRNQLVARGYTAQRIYTTNTDYADGAIGDATPRRFYDGTALPAALAPGTFTWNGSTTDVVNTINAGRFLVLHRDHGFSGGWGDPGFTTGNIPSLTNGNLTPVVFSVNCASGYFDNETDGSGNTGTYFAEALLRKSGGGAVGILGDTRNSPTVQNNALTRGFFDAIWPATLPTYGGTASIKRLGDVLNYGKAYMVSQFGIANSNVQFELAAWHVYGDPTMEIWTSNPNSLVLQASAVIKLRDLTKLIASYPQEGAVITALQDGLPIGRAKVIKGEAVITFLNQPDAAKPIELSASGLDAVATPLFQGDRNYLPLTQQP